MDVPDEALEEEQPSGNDTSPAREGKEYCPRCGRVLEPRKCKLICECGYFMSCSDF